MQSRWLIAVLTSLASKIWKMEPKIRFNFDMFNLPKTIETRDANANFAILLYAFLSL